MNLLRRLSLRAQLLLMFSIIALLSISTVGIIGYLNEKSSLSLATEHHLQSLRDAKASEVAAYFKNIQRHVSTDSANQTTVEALQDFTAGFGDAAAIFPNTDENTTQLRQCYANIIKQERNQTSKKAIDIDTLLPSTAAAKALQRIFLEAWTTRPEISPHSEAFHQSSYFQAHKRLHQSFLNMVKNYHYRNIYLVDTNTGNIVYSVSKNIDFATNLTHGPYADTHLGEVFRKAKSLEDPSMSVTSDLSHYPPTGHIPTAFVASPIADNGRTIGVFIIQIDSTALNSILTGDFNWESRGLGKSGEAYLVGSDMLMRSESRFPIEDRRRFIAKLQHSRADDVNIQLMQTEQEHSTILKEKVDTPSVKMALSGKTGTATISDYRDIIVMSCYAPLKIQDLNWCLLAEIDKAEALAPLRTYQRNVLFSTGAVCLFITLLAFYLSRDFADPIIRLKVGTDKICEGDNSHRIEDRGRDEIAELATSFNRMAETIQLNTNKIIRQNQDNERLLLNILPTSVADKLKRGVKSIAERVDDVSILYANINGFNQLSDALSPEQSVATVNYIISSIDDAADRHGVEKIKTNGTTYIAASGLSSPCDTHAIRIYHFAKEIEKIVQDFAESTKQGVHVSIGISTGTVVAGVVGKNRYSFDLWGVAVNHAKSLQAHQSPHSIKLDYNTAKTLNEDQGIPSLIRIGKIENHYDSVEIWVQMPSSPLGEKF